MVKEIVEKELENISWKEGVTTLTFHATWCGPCRMLMPVLDNVSEARKDLTVLKCDVDQDRDFARKMEVKFTPTTFVFKNGQMVGTIGGYLPEEQFIAEVNKLTVN